MRTIQLEVTRLYTIEINDEDPIVQEYENDQELFDDLATYHFGTGLPVIGEGGVIVKDDEIVEVRKT